MGSCVSWLRVSTLSVSRRRSRTVYLLSDQSIWRVLVFLVKKTHTHTQKSTWRAKLYYGLGEELCWLPLRFICFLNCFPPLAARASGGKQRRCQVPFGSIGNCSCRTVHVARILWHCIGQFADLDLFNYPFSNKVCVCIYIYIVCVFRF
jgi:hypothetical protein